MYVCVLFIEVCMSVCLYVCVCVCIYIHVAAKSNSCKNVVLWGCGKLWGWISYFLANECWGGQWCRSRIL